MGQRDAQQVAVVRKLIADHCFGAEVVVAPIAGTTGWRSQCETATLRPPSARTPPRCMSPPSGRGNGGAGVRSPDRVIAEVTHLLGERRACA